MIVVRDDNARRVAPVRLGRGGRATGVIVDGLKAGERVIVDGFQKFAPATWSIPQPWQTPQAEQRAAAPNADTSVATRLTALVDARVLHRPADLRVGDRAVHLLGGLSRSASAGRAVPDRRAAVDRVTASYPGASAQKLDDSVSA